MRNILQQIKWAYQRVVRNYDDRALWEFDSEFATYLKPIKEFCEQELKEDYIEMNPDRKKVYKRTLKLLDQYDHWEEETVTKFWSYFGKHITKFWN